MKLNFFLLLFFIYTEGKAQIIRAKASDWTTLFNRKNLDGWIPKITNYNLNDNFGNTFRVKDGLMEVRYDQYDQFDERFGHIFYKNKYSNYLISLEYRFVGNQVKKGPEWAIRNSGIMIHCQDPKTMAKKQDFPISIEVQLLGGNGFDKRPTCNLCTPGTVVHMADTLFTPHCYNSTSATYHGAQWVKAEVLVLGDSLIRHYINGKMVLEYTKPEVGGGVVNGFDPKAKIDGTKLTEGYISLQSESHPIDFRNIKLLNLEGCTDSKASNYRSYFVKSDNSKCKYVTKK